MPIEVKKFAKPLRLRIESRRPLEPMRSRTTTFLLNARIETTQQELS